jgi:hypothetical protein
MVEQILIMERTTKKRPQVRKNRAKILKKQKSES